MISKNKNYNLFENKLFTCSDNNVLINKINDVTYEIKMDSKIFAITGLESIRLSNYHFWYKVFGKLGDINTYKDYQDLLEKIKLSLIKKPMVPIEVNYLILNYLIWNSNSIKTVIKKVKRRNIKEDAIFDLEQIRGNDDFRRI